MNNLHYYFIVVLPESYASIHSNTLLEKCLSENFVKLVGNSGFLSVKIVQKHGMRAILEISLPSFTNTKQDVVSKLIYMNIDVITSGANLIEIHEMWRLGL
jgi:hypothetical protein